MLRPDITKIGSFILVSYRRLPAQAQGTDERRLKMISLIWERWVCPVLLLDEDVGGISDNATTTGGSAEACRQSRQQSLHEALEQV